VNTLSWDIAFVAVGLILLIIGVVMWITRTRGGLVLLALGVFWLLTMLIYYAYTYAGIYERRALYPISNIIGVVLIIAGLVIAFVYLKKAKRGG